MLGFVFFKKFIPFWLSFALLLSSVACDDTPQPKAPSSPPATLGERFHEALLYSLNGQQCEAQKRALLDENKAGLISNIDLLFSDFPVKTPDSNLIRERIKSLKNSKIDAVANQFVSLINYRKDDLSDSLETLFPNASLTAPSEEQIWKTLQFLQRDELKTLAKTSVSDADTKEALTILERMQALALSEDGQFIAKAFLGDLAFSLPDEEQVWSALQIAKRPELIGLARSLRATAVEFAKPTQTDTKEMLAITKRLMALAQSDDSRFIQDTLFGEFSLAIPDEDNVWNAVRFARRQDVKDLAASFNAQISEIRTPTKDDTKELLAILGRIRALATSDEGRAIGRSILGDRATLKLDEEQLWNALQFVQRDDVTSLAKNFQAAFAEIQNPTREDTREIRALLERIQAVAVSNEGRAIVDALVGNVLNIKLDEEQIWNAMQLVQRDDVKALIDKLSAESAELAEPTRPETKELLAILERFKVLALSESAESLTQNLLADAPFSMPSEDQVWSTVQFAQRDDVKSLAKSLEVGVAELRNPTKDETKEILTIFDRLKNLASSEKGQLVTSALLGDLHLATSNEEQVWNALQFVQRDEVQTLANNLRATALEFANPSKNQTREMLSIVERLTPIAFSEDAQFINETFFGDAFSQIPSEEYIWSALEFIQREDVRKLLAAVHAGSAEFARPTREDTKEVKQILSRFQARMRGDDGLLIGENILGDTNSTRLDEQQVWKALQFVRRDEVQSLLTTIRSGMLELSNPSETQTEEFLSILRGIEALANSDDGLFIRSGFEQAKFVMPSEEEAWIAYNLLHVEKARELFGILKHLQNLSDSENARLAKEILLGASQMPNEDAVWNASLLAKQIHFASLANSAQPKGMFRILRRIVGFMETPEGKLVLSFARKTITDPTTRTAMLRLAEVVEAQNKPSKENEKWGISLLLGDGWTSYLAREGCVAWLNWWYKIEAKPIREAFDLGMMLYKKRIIDDVLTIKNLTEDLAALHPADFDLIQRIREELATPNGTSSDTDLDALLVDPNNQKALLWLLDVSFEKGGVQSLLRVEQLARELVSQNSIELEPFKRMLGDFTSFMLDQKNEDLTKKSYKMAFLNNDAGDLMQRLRTLTNAFFKEHQSDLYLASTLAEELTLIFAEPNESDEKRVRRYASYLNNSEYKKTARQIYDRLLTKGVAQDLLRLNELSFGFESEHKATIALALTLADEFGLSFNKISRESVGRFVLIANEAKHRKAAMMLLELTSKPGFVDDLLRLDALSQELWREHKGDVDLIKKLAQEASGSPGGLSREQVAQIVSFASHEKRQAAAKVIFEVVQDKGFINDILRLHQLSQDFLVVRQNDLKLIKDIAEEYKISIADITREQVGKFVSYVNDSRHQQGAKALFTLATDKDFATDIARLEALARLFLEKNKSDVELAEKLASELGLSSSSISHEQIGRLIKFVSSERNQNAAKALLRVAIKTELVKDLIRLQQLSRHFLVDHRADVDSIKLLAKDFGFSFESMNRAEIGNLVTTINDEGHRNNAKTFLSIATQTSLLKDLVRLVQLSGHFLAEHQTDLKTIQSLAKEFGLSLTKISRSDVKNFVAYANDEEHQKAAKLLFAMMSKPEVVADLTRLDALAEHFLLEHQSDIDHIETLARDFGLTAENVSRDDVHNVVEFVSNENHQQAAKRLFALVSRREVLDDFLRLDELSREIFSKQENVLKILSTFAQELGLSLDNISKGDVHAALSFAENPRHQEALKVLFEIGVEVQIFLAQAQAQLGSPVALSAGSQAPNEASLVFALLGKTTKEDVRAFTGISKLAFSLWSMSSKNQCQPASESVLHVNDLREGLVQMSRFLTTPEYGFRSWLSLLRRMASDFES